jgi:tagatose 1,6-diphosphate aldolase
MPARQSLTPGKIRGLTQTSTPEGIFTILAIDHRDSLKVVLAPQDPASVSAEAVTDVKLGLLRDLGGSASGVMLDPEFSIGQAVTTRALPGRLGFLAAIEAQGYLGDPTARATSLLDGWSVDKAKRAGASGIKLLVLYRPDSGALAEAQEHTIAAVIADCARADIPLFLEPLVYGLVDDTSTPEGPVATRREIVIGSVQRLGALGPDVLKVQFPVDTQREHDRQVWVDACAELDEASPVPWALLSGGDPFGLFREQVQVASAAGASGFMVGRAVWGELVTADPSDRPRLVDEVVRPRFDELVALAGEHGHDWAARHRLPSIDEHWYLTY